MATTVFDTLNAARRLKSAGIKAEHAEAIAEVMGLYFNQPRLATAEHRDAHTASLHAANTRLHARLDTANAGLCTRIGAGKVESAARRDAVQSTARSEVPARTDTVGIARWTDCIDAGVEVVWLSALIAILAYAYTLLYIV